MKCESIITTVSALAAAASAVIAAYQLIETRESQEQSDRAYLFARPTMVVNMNGGQPVEAYVEVLNVGKTPALNVRQKALVTVRKLPAPTQLADLGRFVEEIGSTVIHPGTRHFLHRRLDANLQMTDRAEIVRARVIPSNDESVVVVAGRIEYDDIYRKKRHWTDFCFLFFGQLNEGLPGTGYSADSLRHCEYLNRTDDF